MSICKLSVFKRKLVIEGVFWIIFGRLNWFKGKASIPHPEMELETNFKNKTKRSFYPIYPSTEKLINKGISQKVIQNLMAHLIDFFIYKYN